jgi:hypothetical protein
MGAWAAGKIRETAEKVKTETAPEGAAPMTRDGAGYFKGS